MANLLSGLILLMLALSWWGADYIDSQLDEQCIRTSYTTVPVYGKVKQCTYRLGHPPELLTEAMPGRSSGILLLSWLDRLFLNYNGIQFSPTLTGK